MYNQIYQEYIKRLSIGEELYMLVDEQFRKCVTFLFVDKTDPVTGIAKKTPVATAFVANVPVEQYSFLYAITTRHVLDKSRLYGRLWARINKKDGGFVDFPVYQDSWILHSSTDIAVISIKIDQKEFDIVPLPLSLFATDEYVKKKKIGAGDNVFFIGLFSRHPGYERNQPIIRFGNISLMPFEKVYVNLTPESKPVPINAYLVEARSWGGHSGSPAFIYYPLERKPGLMKFSSDSQLALLGMVHGHYDIEQDIDFLGDILGSGKVPINAGIAVVVPAQDIIDTLMQQHLVNERENIIKKTGDNTNIPTPD